ncbi:angiogenic factor with G patch and FHA domains 1-like [Centruroides sculpturatus]|uniref:angiogenic factor with G patch and FHA domains 1-like n=1 Tax=Centruroides sculpturatus TaxID=218467 RepID=UPI000C6CBD87|nr:angiogenic factor with G patch and FHA domains 1-like [Centruroides sculpturatus]
MKYLYCSDTQSYKFISEESKPEELHSDKKNKKTSKKRRQTKVQKLSKNIKLEKVNNNDIEEFDSDSNNENNAIKSPSEDGEILDSSSCENNSSDTEELIEDEDASKQWPPCIRVIVLESEKLQIGSLLLITYTGSTIGRDQNKDLFIPDLSVSKSHADIKFNSDERCYVITDLGSQNGTYLNEFRLSEAKQISHSYPLKHGDNLRIGNCKLLLHIHEGTETCNDCEPGQVQAELLTKHPMDCFIYLCWEMCSTLLRLWKFYKV